MGKKLVRVELEFEDGETARLADHEAQRWIESVNALISVASMHGFPMQEFPWVRISTQPNQDEAGKDDG